MCSFAAASLALTGLGAVAQGASQYQQAKYQAAVARNNRILAERQAQDALARGEIAGDQQRQKTGLMLGAQRARLAAQGTALDEGSPLDIQGDTAVAGELEALTIRNNAEREAYGYRVQAAGFEAQRRLAQSRAGIFGVGETLLAGATSVADRWGRYRQQGVSIF